MMTHKTVLNNMYEVNISNANHRNINIGHTDIHL